MATDRACVMCQLPMETTMTLFQVRVLHTHVLICGYNCVAPETTDDGRKHCTLNKAREG